MKINYSVSVIDPYEHVRCESWDEHGSLEEFSAFIEGRWSGEKHWRHRPDRMLIRSFEEDGERVRFYARFSVAFRTENPAVSRMLTRATGGFRSLPFWR